MANDRTTTLPPPLERIRAMAAEARERQAEAVYNLETVLDVMRDAAGDGLNTVTIAPGKPIDLRETDAAKVTKAALESEGFRVEWEPQATKPGEAPSQALKIIW